MMINEQLKESLTVLEKDASFIKRIRDIIRDTENTDLSDEERLLSIKKAQAWILHMLDFFVTVDMIDMEADLLRLCDDDPQAAAHFQDSLNDVALSLKQNYQFLCKEGTIYGPQGLPLFKQYYAAALMAHISEQKSGKTLSPPIFFLSYSEIEFISAGDSLPLLRKKLEHLPNVEFSINSIQLFIDNCFAWSDRIKDYLARMRENKTIYEINRQALNSIHAECNGVVYYETTADQFASAIMNYEKPSFHLMNKDRFYAVLYALYLKMGALSTRDKWLNTVLTSFELEKANYSSTVRRITTGKTDLLSKFYDRIISILENCGV